MILCTDPGQGRRSGIGWAHFHPMGELARAGFIKANAKLQLAERVKAMHEELHALRLENVRRVCVELPRVYPGDQQKGDQNDLMPLALVAGLVAGLYPYAALTIYYPRDWKGTMDADEMTKRIEGRLTPLEYTRVQLPAASLAHNVFDAIGIGLHFFGRLAPRKVYAR